MSYEMVMGLEVHVQLSTKTKLFSHAFTAFGQSPNSQAALLDLALPGTLPVLNRGAVTLAIRLALALEAQIHPETIFTRKHYFYPDLPKGYQISQLNEPIVFNGKLEIEVEGEPKTIRIQRAHLEEDAGKSIHDQQPHLTALDFNRAGTPLLEIVTDPDFRSIPEVLSYLKKLHHLVRYLGISDGNMQEGSFRADINLSLRKNASAPFGTRVELKNLNSFKFIERAIEVEAERQASLLDQGQSISQETRLFDPDLDETRAMRSKETAEDYRYFPDPDLLPVCVSQDWIDSVKATLPKMPWTRAAQYREAYGFSNDDIELLLQQAQIADYFEKVVEFTQEPKRSANWLIGEILPRLQEDALSFQENPLSPETLSQLIQKITDGTLSNKTAKIALDHLWKKAGSLETIIQRENLAQVSDTGALTQHVETLFAQFPAQIEELRSGKDKVIGFLVGQVMKASQGKANASEIQRLIRERLLQK